MSAAAVQISRSAPITIGSTQRSRDNPQGDTSNKIKHSPPHMNGSTITTTAGEPPNVRSRRDRPCDACRRRKSRCVIHEGQESCALCQFHKQECTFVQSPQPRKRRLNSDSKEDQAAKQRYVMSLTLWNVSQTSLQKRKIKKKNVPVDPLPRGCKTFELMHSPN
jgi:hypothetical protein